MRFVDVTNDIAFRKIFGNESQKKSLISFLNAVINLPDSQRITDVHITNPYQLSKFSSGKVTIVDVKATDERGNTFIVEMQVAEYAFFHKRILYYTSQGYTAQIEKGEEYEKLKPVYFIGILQFEIGSNPTYFSRHKVLDVETNEQIIRDVEFNFIELPKFNKQLSELTTLIDQWTYFIKNAENINVVPESVTDEGLQQAYQGAERYTWTKLELEEYLKAGLKRGDDKGILSLVVKRAEEKTKKQNTYEIAKKLKDKGIDIETIVETTGLTKEEIEGL